MLRYLVFAAALQQIVVPFFVNPFGGGGRTGAVAQGSVSSGIEPAGYAFVIWTAIYGGALAYAAWQLTAAGRAEPVTTRIAIPLVILYFGSSAWLYFAKYGPLWATVPTLAVMAAMAIVVLVVVSSARPAIDSWTRWALLILPIALYAGWTSCAVFVNFAEVAPGYGFARLGLSREGFAVAALLGATGLAIGVLWATSGQPAYAATVVWALAAIVVAVVLRGEPGSIAATSALGMIAVTVASWWLRKGAYAPQLT